MALESGTYVKDLVDTNPTGTDPISLGDDHIRLIKKVLGNSFPSSISAATVPDVSGNGEKYLQVNTGATGTQWASVSVRSRGSLNRSQFDHSSDTVLLIGAGQYDHDGATVQDVYWDSQIEFTIGSGGSNSGSSAAGTSQWQYLYLDDSAIVTQGAALLDADCFLNSTTAPTYSQTKHGWYSGSDRCIFSFYIDGDGDIAQWFHNGGEYVMNSSPFDDGTLSSSGSWQTETLTVPAFCIKAEVDCAINNQINAHDTQWWRVNGTEPSPAHLLTRSEGDEAEFIANSVTVYLDGSRQLQILTNNASVLTYTAGYFLPGGM